MSNKLSHHKISVSAYGGDTIGDLRKEIRRINKEKFGGKSILKLTDKCTFEVSYDGCYYESDLPSVVVVIPYKKPSEASK